MDMGKEAAWKITGNWLEGHVLYEPHHEKTCLCHMRTTKTQISLCILAVWSVITKKVRPLIANRQTPSRPSYIVYANGKCCCKTGWTSRLTLAITVCFCDKSFSHGPTHLSHIMRKPVYAMSEQQRRRSACASTQSDQHLCYSLAR